MASRQQWTVSHTQFSAPYVHTYLLFFIFMACISVFVHTLYLVRENSSLAAAEVQVQWFGKTKKGVAIAIS